MEKKKYSPAALRSMAVTISVVVLATVIVTVMTVLSGTDRTKPNPMETETTPQTNAPSSTWIPGEETEGNDGPSKPIDLPADTDPIVPTGTPITWYVPVDGAYLSKGHDLTKQVFSQTMNDYRVHCGVDLQAPIGSDVMAVADGVVENIFVDPFEGTCLSIAHAGGYLSVYKNLSPALLEGLKEGDSVMGGQTVASVGESAIIEISEEAHLHFELYRNDKTLDPMEFIPYQAEDANYDE